MSVAQAFALARLAERAGEGFVFGPEPFTEENTEKLNIAAWLDGELLHVLPSPPGEWASVGRAGRVVGR